MMIDIYRHMCEVLSRSAAAPTIKKYFCTQYTIDFSIYLILYPNITIINTIIHNLMEKVEKNSASE